MTQSGIGLCHCAWTLSSILRKHCRGEEEKRYRSNEHSTGVSLTVVMFSDFASAVSLLTGHPYYVSEVVNTGANNCLKFAIILRYTTVGRTPLDE